MNNQFLTNVLFCLSCNPTTAQNIGNGWTYAVNYRQFQKVNNKIYVYVLVQGNRVLVQAYYRGDIGMCCLENRFRINRILEAFKQGDKWLKQYGNDVTTLHLDDYHPFRSNNKIPYHI